MMCQMKFIDKVNGDDKIGWRHIGEALILLGFTYGFILMLYALGG